MRLTVHEIRLTQHYVWRSAREAIAVQPALLVEVAQDGQAGYGEASAFMTSRYNSGLDAMHAALRRVAPTLSTLDASDPALVWRTLAPSLVDSPFVLAAVDGAVNDLRARLAGVPLWRSLGLTEPTNLRSSYSIGLDEPEVMVAKLLGRPGFATYKVKISDPSDLGILAALREHTKAPFLVDGNCGWRLEPTLDALGDLAKLGVVLLEQPFNRDNWPQARTLREAAPFPIFADESITGPADLDTCVDAFDGVNIKPMKAGGITPALAMLRRARQLGLGTMLGCMPESAAGVSATAHLGGLADHLDIDSLVLLDVNTGDGVRLADDGGVIFRDRPGTGYTPDWTTRAFTVRTVGPAVVRPVRHQVLRPGAAARDLVYPGDDHPAARHFAAYTDGELVGSASSYREALPTEQVAAVRDAFGADVAAAAAWRLRGMATLPQVRGQGIGAALLRTALTCAVGMGADLVWCNARTTAAGFYLRAGFEVVGAEYDIPGIGPHLFMIWRPA